jgi:hypothetical protein
MASIRSLRKLAPGEKLPAIPRDSFNTIIDAKTLESQRKFGAQVPKFIPQGNTIVLVRNDSGSDVPRFGPLGIDEPIILPADNENRFAMEVALKCVTPSAGGSSEDDNRGRFVICAEPIANGKIGRAFIAGVCACKLIDTSSDNQFGVTTGEFQNQVFTMVSQNQLGWSFVRAFAMTESSS